MANTSYPKTPISLAMLGQEGRAYLEAWDEEILRSAPFPQLLFITADRWYNAAAFKAKFGVARQVLKPPELDAKASPAAVAQYTADKATYNEVVKITHELKQKFLQRMSPADQNLLKKQGDDRILAAYSLQELHDQFSATFGQIHQHELQQMRHSLANPGAPITTSTLPEFIQNFQKMTRTLKDIGREVSDGDQIDAFMTGIGGPTGPFHNAILNFTQKPEGERTIASLQQDAQADALRRLALPQPATTAQAAGFANAASSTAQAPPPSPANTAGPGARGTGGRGGGRGGGRQVIPTKDGGRLSTGRLRLDRATGVVIGIKKDDYYCWSHGPHGAHCGFTPHESSGCRNKLPGHQDTATFDDIQGGRTIFCHHDRYVNFPHA